MPSKIKITRLVFCVLSTTAYREISSDHSQRSGRRQENVDPAAVCVDSLLERREGNKKQLASDTVEKKDCHSFSIHKYNSLLNYIQY